MTKISITKAAKMAGISRQHLYKHYINTGKLSVTKDNDKSTVDISELLRVFPDAKELTADTLQNTTVVDSENSELVKLLKAQLAEAKEREEWLKLQLENSQNTIKLLEDKTKKRKKFLGIF